MTTRWSLTFDCENALAMAAFWVVALGYVDRPPPQGWDTWQAWLEHVEVPESEWDDGAAIEDPDGRLPAISFLRVPEPKSVKNRLHLDLHVSGGRHLDARTRTAAPEAHLTRLLDAGGTVLTRHHQPDGSLDHVVVADPEGNELCLV